MLELLSRARCRVEIADFMHFGGIDLLNSAEPGPSLAAAAESWFVKQAEEDPLDLILCWDLPNYLTLDALSALMIAIGRRARPGAIVHALIFYAGHEMRDHPGRFIPTGDYELLDFAAQGAPIASPRYSPEDLRHNMGLFEIDRARLLQNGMQEYQFRLGSGH